MEKIKIIRKEKEEKILQPVVNIDLPDIDNKIDKKIENSKDIQSSKNLIVNERLTSLNNKILSLVENQKNNDLLYKELTEKYNQLNETLPTKLVELYQSYIDKSNEFTAGFASALSDFNSNNRNYKKHYQALEDKITEAENNNLSLGDLLRQHIQNFNTELTDIENQFTVHSEQVSSNISKLNSEFEAKLSELDKKINNTNLTLIDSKKEINENFDKTDLKIQENKKELLKSEKSLSDKIEKKSEDTYKILSKEIEESIKKFNKDVITKEIRAIKKQLKKDDTTLSFLNDRFKQMGKNILDKVKLSSDMILSQTDIEQIIKDAVLSDIQGIKSNSEENKNDIKILNSDLGKIKKNIDKVEKILSSNMNKSVEEKLKKLEKEFSDKLNLLENELKKSLGNKKYSIDRSDLEKVLYDNPDLFKGEPGRIPNHQVQGDWIFFEKPDGTWGQPIRLGNSKATFSGIVGGGGGSGVSKNTFFRDLLDVDGNTFNRNGVIPVLNTNNHKLVGSHKIDDTGTSNTDIWTANKIIDYVEEVAGDYIPTSEKGQANGVAPLNSSTKVDAQYLPSYVDDIIEVDTYDELPNPGETGKIYITLDTNACYRWSGSIYVKIADEDKVPYTGADKNVDLNSHGITQEYSKFNIDSVESVDADDGKLDWDEYYKTLKLKVPRSFFDTPEPETPEIYLINQQLKAVTYNPTRGYNHKGWALSADYTDQAASSDLKALITDVCYISDEDDAEGFIGIASEDNKASRIGGLTSYGIIENMNTSYFTRGDKLWLCDATEENHRLYYTNSEPIPPLKKVFVGWVTKVGTTDGVIFIDKRIFPRLSELSGMYGTLNTTGQIYTWNEEQGYFEVNDNLNLTAGCVVLPTIEYEEYKGALTGNVILGNGIFTVYSGNKGESPLKRYEIAGATYTLTQNSKNYIIFNGNTGTIQVITNRDTPTLINQLDVIPIYTLYCSKDNKDVIEIIDNDWNHKALGLANKTADRLVRTQRWDWESGLNLTANSSTLDIQIDSGYLWHGSTRNSLAQFNSTNVNHLCYKWYKVGAEWRKEQVTQYDITQYNNTSAGLATLSDNYYNIQWIYRAILRVPDGEVEIPHACILMSQDEYRLNEVMEVPAPTDIPPQFQLLGVLVGRIICKKGEPVALITSAFNNTSFDFIDHHTINRLDDADDTLISNGIISGMTITKASDTTFNISSGEYYFVEDGKVTYGGENGITADNIADGLITYIAMDEFQNVIQKPNIPFTPEERRNYIILGAIVHSDKTIINVVNNMPEVAQRIGSQFYDLLDSLKEFNYNGNEIDVKSPFYLTKSEGYIFKKGSNFLSNSNNPHLRYCAEKDSSVLGDATIRFRTQNGVESADTGVLNSCNISPLGDINPFAYYDNGGTLTALSGGTQNFQIFRIGMFASSNLIRIQWGQAYYKTMAEAFAGITSEDFAVEENLKQNGLFRALLIVHKSCTDLNNSTQAQIVTLNRWGEINNVAGVGGTTDLQQAYTNSLNPELETLNGALTLKNGNVNDTTNVLEIANYAGTPTASITGDGTLNTPKIQFDDNIIVTSDVGMQEPKPNIIIGDSDDILYGNSNTVIGNLSVAGGRLQTSKVGAFPIVYDEQSCGVAIGCSSTALSTGSIAIGNNSYAGAYKNPTISDYGIVYDNAIAIGVGARAEAPNSIAIGTGCVNDIPDAFRINHKLDVINSGGIGVYFSAYDTVPYSFLTGGILDMYAETGNSCYLYMSSGADYLTIDYNDTDGIAKFLNTTGNGYSFDGDVTVVGGGVTLDSTELLTIGTGEITHNGTEFTANDDINLGANDIQATEFRMGANATIKFNAITNSIDFIIN